MLLNTILGTIAKLVPKKTPQKSEQIDISTTEAIPPEIDYKALLDEPYWHRLYNSNLARLVKNSYLNKDSELIKLPYPIAIERPTRTENKGCYGQFLEMFNPRILERLEKHFVQHPLVKPYDNAIELVNLIENEIDRKILEDMASIYGYTTELFRAQIANHLIQMTYKSRRGVLIQTTQELENMLMETDIASNITEEFFVAPFDDVYLHFNKPLALNNKTKYIVGAYVFMHEIKNVEIGHGVLQIDPDVAKKYAIQPGDNIKNVDISFVFQSTNTERNVIQFGIISMENLCFKYGSEIPIINIWRNAVTEDADTETKQNLEIAIGHIIKIFLYTSLKESRVVESNVLSMSKERINGLGQKKRGKLERKLSTLYDYIIVGPESDLLNTGIGEEGRRGTPHWRRGHFRMQPYGEKQSLRKLIFIKPILIGLNKLQGDIPNPKIYKVK